MRLNHSGAPAPGERLRAATTGAFAVLLATATALWSEPVRAHDAWVAPGPGPTWPILYGHEEPEGYAASKVQSVKAFDLSGDPVTVEVERGPDGATVRAATQPALFVVDFDNGFFSRVDGQTRNVGKREAPQGTNSSHPLKWSKTVLAWSAQSSRPLGQRLEIVPGRPAAEPTAGQTMTLQVLLDGRPLAGARIVLVGSKQVFQADNAGQTTYRVGSGVQRLSVEHRMPTPEDPDADTLAMNASLVFLAR